MSTAGVEANGPSGPPSISGNGRFVVFASAATNLVAGDTNAVADIFLRDRDTDADGIFDEAGAVSTTRISLGPSAVQADGPSSSPVISADGRYVAFVSTATNLVAGANAFEQIYRVDRTTGDVVRVSENVAGEAGDGASATPVIDADGDVIAFQSMAGNLDGSTGAPAIFARAVTADLTTRITEPDPSPGPGLFLPVSYSSPSISADGNRIAYRGQRIGPLTLLGSGVRPCERHDDGYRFCVHPVLHPVGIRPGSRRAIHRVAGRGLCSVASSTPVPTRRR